MSALLVVDCPAGSPAPSMQIAGMSLLERILRDHARRGAKNALVRGDSASLPTLRNMPLEISVAAADAPVPPGAQRVRGDEYLGVTIATEQSRRAVEWSLMQTCRRHYDGPGDKYVIRPVSLRLSRYLTQFAITPNQVTFVSMGVGLTAITLAAAGGWPAVWFAGLLMLGQVVLDSVDGELARVRHMGSKLGMWLDNVSDDVIDNMLVLALGAGIGGPWATVGLLAALGRGFSAAVTYMGARALGQPGDVAAFRWWFEDGDTVVEVYSGPPSIASALRSLGRRDTYMLVFGASCIIGLPQVAFTLGVVNSAVYFGMAVVHLVARKGRF